MAKIPTGQTERTYKIENFLGVNESPDGDTGLKLGEAAVMRNFRITKERNLQIRPGCASKVTVAADKDIRGMWHGYVNGTEVWLCACNGHVYSINKSTFAATSLGTLTDDTTTFFGFQSKVYILNGHEYKYWDGTTFGDVEGYIPYVACACDPSTGGGTAVQQVNKLNGKRYKTYSADGSTVFYIGETALSSIDYVYVGGVLKTVTTDYTVDLLNGTVTFDVAPASGTDNVKIYYTAGSSDRATIVAQLYSEMYNGYTDNRVFLYGDGTNKAYYSGLEYSTGLPTAEYFPDLNVLDIGTTNTPITSMVRHFNKLMSFKSDGTYLSYYDTVILEDGSVTAGFYTRAIEKEVGNEAYGQVKLINNYPISLHGNSIYRWSLIYTSGTQDERAAKRISGRVVSTLGDFDMSNVITFDDEYNREFWVVDDGTAVIYNYSYEADYGGNYKNNVLYTFTDVPAACFIQIDGEVYFGTSDGRIMHFSRDYHSDDGSEIDAYWESGSMSFDANYMRKMLTHLYTSMKPESAARLAITFETDNKSDFDEKLIASSLLTFEHIDFAHWSFKTNRKPQVEPTKLKAKKFVYLKLIIKSESSSATGTLLSVDLPISYTSKAK